MATFSFFFMTEQYSTVRVWCVCMRACVMCARVVCAHVMCVVCVHVLCLCVHVVCAFVLSLCCDVCACVCVCMRVLYVCVVCIVCARVVCAHVLCTRMLYVVWGGVCACHIFFVHHLLMNTEVVSVLAVVNNAAMNTAIYVLFQITGVCLFVCFQKYTQSGISASDRSYIFSF